MAKKRSTTQAAQGAAEQKEQSVGSTSTVDTNAKATEEQSTEEVTSETSKEQSTDNTDTTTSESDSFGCICIISDAPDILKAAWEDKVSDGFAVEVFDSNGKEFIDVLGEILVSEHIDGSFVLVPSNCFPTHKLAAADLLLYRVREFKSGEVTPITGLPTLIVTQTAIEVLEHFKGECSELEFYQEYIRRAHSDELPDKVSMHYGNTVGYVSAESPNLDRVKDAIKNYKFLVVPKVELVVDVLKPLYDK